MECVSKQDYDCMISIAKAMYEKVVNECGEEDAYNWVTEHIDAHFQNQIGIKPVRTYKAVTVTMEMKLIVPKIWEKVDIEDYAFTLPLANEANNVTITDLDEECTHKDVETANFEYATVLNDPSKFTDADFIAGYGYHS